MTKRNFLLGKGERLTEDIAGVRGGGPKSAPYTFTEARARLAPRLAAAVERIDALPREACPGDQAIVSVTLNPEYIAKSYYPHDLLTAAGVTAVGSRPRRIKPGVVAGAFRIGLQRQQRQRDMQPAKRRAAGKLGRLAAVDHRHLAGSAFRDGIGRGQSGLGGTAAEQVEHGRVSGVWLIDIHEDEFVKPPLSYFCAHPAPFTLRSHFLVGDSARSP